VLDVSVAKRWLGIAIVRDAESKPWSHSPDDPRRESGESLRWANAASERAANAPAAAIPWIACRLDTPLLPECLDNVPFRSRLTALPDIP
jgi:hypothetical protein